MSFYTDIVKKDRSLMLIIMSFHKTKTRRKYDKVMDTLKFIRGITERPYPPPMENDNTEYTHFLLRMTDEYEHIKHVFFTNKVWWNLATDI